MIFAFNSVGKYGFIKDIPPHELPPGAWSDGMNISFYDDYAERTNGYTSVFGGAPVPAYSLLPLPQNITYFWLQMGLEKVYVYDGSAHVNITRQTTGVDVNYTGSANNIWTSCVLGGIPVLNNGVDPPQMWLPANTATKLERLSNWPADTICDTMRNYKQFLIALNITKPSSSYPSMVKWSHPADPGTVPISWDETDPTRDAGEYTLSETGDYLVDCAVMRDANILYKENTVWGMQFIGGNDIFRFQKLFGQFGALNKNCITEFLIGKHLVLTSGDVVVHDSQSADSILSKRMRKWLTANINDLALKQCFVVTYSALDEVWICIPTGTSARPDIALVWNWRTGTVGLRALPLPSYMAEGLVLADNAVAADAWSAASGSWDSETSAWGSRLYTSSAPSLMMATISDSGLYKIDAEVGTQNAVLERTGLSVPIKQQLLPDFTAMKFLREVWPRIEGTEGGVVNVEVGTQMQMNSPVVWKPAQPFIIGTSQNINATASGRSFGLRFSSNTEINWRIAGYELDIEFSGNF